MIDSTMIVALALVISSVIIGIEVLPFNRSCQIPDKEKEKVNEKNEASIQIVLTRSDVKVNKFHFDDVFKVNEGLHNQSMFTSIFLQ